MSDAHHHDVSKHVKIYVGVFLALAILTVVTVYAASWKVAVAAHVTIAMLIALAKSSLVFSFFMHFVYEKKKTLIMLLIVSAIFFLALMFLPVLTVHETAEHFYVP